MEEILIELAKNSPIIAVLCLGIWDFRKRLSKKEEDNAKLMEEKHQLSLTFIDGYKKISDLIAELNKTDIIDKIEIKNQLNKILDELKK